MPLLPWLGLGISTNLDPAAAPHPYRLKARAPELIDFVEYSAPLRLHEARAHAGLFAELWRRRQEVPVLFHPVHLNLYGPRLEDAVTLTALDAHVREVGSAWVGNDVAWWHSGGQPFPGFLYLEPTLDEAGLADAVAHARHVQRHLSVPVALENPAVRVPEGDWHVLDFMARLHAATGQPLILDLAHLFGFQLAKGLPLEAGFEGFPFDAVIELHLAGGVVTERGGRASCADDHTQPVRQEVLSLFERVLPHCSRLLAVTFEADGHSLSSAEVLLRRLRALVPARGEPIDWPLPRPEPVSEPSRKSAARLEALLRASDSPNEVHRAESDYRLAVLAQELGREWPLTQLLLGSTRAQLARFSASEDFVASQLDGSSLSRAWSRFAGRIIREEGDEAAAAALAFEVWSHAVPALKLEGLLEATAPIALGSFSFCFAEALHAARALRVHFQTRAPLDGAWTGREMEGLRQVLLRAPRTGWPVAIRRASRVDWLDDPELVSALGDLASRPAGESSEQRSVLPVLIACGWLRWRSSPFAA